MVSGGHLAASNSLHALSNGVEWYLSFNPGHSNGLCYPILFDTVNVVQSRLIVFLNPSSPLSERTYLEDAFGWRGFARVGQIQRSSYSEEVASSQLNQTLNTF